MDFFNKVRWVFNVAYHNDTRAMQMAFD